MTTSDSATPEQPDLPEPSPAPAEPEARVRGTDVAGASDSAEPVTPPEPRYGRRRRAPRYGSFVFTGIVIGVVLAVILSFARPASGQFSQNSVTGYVAAIFGLVGALAGAAAAIFFDRRRPPNA